MSNDAVYAAGLLNRALDPSTQPAEIKSFLQAEIELLDELVEDAMRVVDIGCGTGRHLFHLSDRVRLGVGIDYERTYIAAAARQCRGHRVHFLTADATALPLPAGFDMAMCLTNTWGTMSDKRGVLREMRRVAPRPHTRLLSVYSDTSVAPRREWYQRLGQPVHEETPEYLASDGGFRSEHFTETRIRDIVGECTVRPLSGIAYAVMF